MEGRLWEALERVGLVKGAGEAKAHDFSVAERTDKMVSAAGNVVALRLHVSEEEEKELVRRINSALPEDILVLAYSRVADAFDAAAHCTARTYRYFFFKEELSVGAMDAAARQFLGVHDFRRFCKLAPGFEESSTVRTVFTSAVVDLQPASDFLPMAYYDCRASDFLWHQVR